MTCKHQLVKNTVYYVERALSGRVERIPPQDQLVIQLTAKPADKARSEVGKKPAAPGADRPVSGVGWWVICMYGGDVGQLPDPNPGRFVC